MRYELAFEKFFDRVEATGFCWLWRGEVTDKGYGRSYLQGKTLYAHRQSYQMLIGPIPEGLTLDHLCRIRNCVNPDHLEPVTLEENLARAKRFRNLANTHTRTRKPKRREGYCHNGHELTPDNVLIGKRSNGAERRQCKVCQHEVQERYRRSRGIPEQGRRGSYGPRKAA